MTAPTVATMDWHRLDPRMLAVGPLRGLIQLFPLVAVLVLTGSGEPWRLSASLVVGVLVVAVGIIRWRTTRYRITDERVELHTGWLNRQQRSVPLDRIRTVDLTARLLHRLFGLSVVRIGAGTGDPFADSRGVSLDAVSTAEAERLRRLLLERVRQIQTRSRPAATASSTAASSTAASSTAASSTAASSTEGTPTTGTPIAGTASAEAAPAGAATPGGADAPDLPEAAAQPQSQELARIDWSWLRFAPLTVTSVVGIGVILSAAYNLVESIGIRPRDLPGVSDATRQLNAVPLWLSVLQVGGVLLVLALAGAVLVYVERWWGYLLTREPDDSLLMRRGLLTRRSLAIAQERLRGTEIVEGLLLRAGRGGQTRALATGLSQEAQGGAILPPAPLAQAHRVAGMALREPTEQTTQAPLARHPRAALSRRLTRALLPAAVLVTVAWVVASRFAALSWLWPAALLLLPVAIALGLDRYRNLGHGLTQRYLVSRQGSLLRRTVALQRDGIIGWRVHQTIFQRRAGLVTAEAITAAGRGGYELVDIAPERAAELIAATTPEAAAGLLSTGR